MCGIAGYLRLSNIKHAGSGREFADFFTEMCMRSARRGPDSIGMVAFNFEVNDSHRDVMDTRNWRNVDREELVSAWVHGERWAGVKYQGVSLTFRGIPTTEQFGHAALSDDEIQPFTALNVTVAHNGLLSNDRALYKQLNWLRLAESGDHDIDSYAFIHAATLHRGAPARYLNILKGSWAVAIVDHLLQTITLSRTFLGLHLCALETMGTRYLCWSSEPFPRIPPIPCAQYYAWEMHPYNHLTITWKMISELAKQRGLQAVATMLEMEQIPITATKNNNSVAVICSGGLDSTTAATMACEQYTDVRLLHFLYGARAQSREMEAVRAIHTELKKRFSHSVDISLEFIDLTYLMKLGGSTLTNHNLEVAEGELGVETAHEWVPARNLAMTALTAAYCDRHDTGNIMLGTNREESAVFNDNSSEFHRAMDTVLPLCTQARPRIVAPLENMMKHHIVKKALAIEAPIDLSWSCYHGGKLHCGKCGPCYLRRTAFAMNNVDDNIEYEQPLEAVK